MKGSTTQLCAEAIMRMMKMSSEEINAISKKVYKTAQDVFDYHIWKKQMEQMLKEV